MAITATGAPAPDDFRDPALELDAADAMDVLRAAQGEPVAVDASLARKLEAWFTASAPGPVPALPEDVRRFVPKGEMEPPLHRWRIVDGNVVERWEPVERRCNSSDLATIALLAGQDRVIGWNVVRLPLPRQARVARIAIEGDEVVAYDGFGRRVKIEPGAGKEFREKLLSLQLAPEDDATYNGFYPTIPGNDVVHYNDAKDPGRWRNDMAEHQGGEAYRNPTTPDGLLRGGKEIRGGRRERRELAKAHNLIEVDAGFGRDVDRIAAEKKAKRQADNKLRIEKTLRAGPEKPNDV